MPLNFVALDFETANQKRGSVIQIGIARVENGVVTKKATRFITPPPGLERFDWHSSKVHGITPGDVRGAPTWPQILEILTRYADGVPLVAHAAAVERSCIDQASAAHGITPAPFKYFCSLRLAKAVWPHAPSHSLGKLSAHLGLPDFAHHDAGEDAVASAVLVLKAAEILGATEFEQMAGAWLPTKS